MSGTTTSTDHEVLETALGRLASDLALVVDREISVEEVSVQRLDRRVAGTGRIHISFKLGFRWQDERAQGCVLVPLPEALALSSYLLMAPDEEVDARRAALTLDRGSKEAMLELGNFVAGACDAVLRELLGGPSVRSEGCQGVRPDVRPKLDYREGSELVVARARARIGDFPPFELVAMFPVLGPLA